MKIFSNFPVEAGFTTKPIDGKLFREELKKKGYVARPGLVHGCHIVKVDYSSEGEDGYLATCDGDGAVTDKPGIYLTTTHGDCLPLWACDPKAGVIGLAHAGWRGTLKGIASELIQAMVREYGCRPEAIHACIGPGIGACCFEVGPDVAELFLDRFYWAEEYVYNLPGKRPYVDLKGINGELFAMEGVENIEISSHCSCCEPELFWSYRRQGDRTRMLAYIALKEAGYER